MCRTSCLFTTTTIITTTVATVHRHFNRPHRRPTSRSFPLLLIRNPSSFRLTLSNFPQIHPNSSSSKRVQLRLPAVFLISGSKPTDQRV
ncbi:hypothetical protein HanIR_Chr08g0372591 [Helianthus annuus]|nr:hypothetical protein HanIR_Chr08g0372591 [Helianthus annuus]